VPKPSVYIETSVVSYLCARPSKKHIVAAHQELTRAWWSRRDGYDLFASEVVVAEASAGDAGAAARRLAALRDIPLLAQSAETMALARELVARGGLPSKAAVDALHVAIAAFGGVDYLLTWNCPHIADAALRGRLEATCRAMGVEPPVICTPEELTEEVAS